MIKIVFTASQGCRLGRRHSLVRLSLAGGNVKLKDHRHLTIKRGYRLAAPTEIHVAAPRGTGNLPRSTALPDTQRTRRSRNPHRSHPAPAGSLS